MRRSSSPKQLRLCCQTTNTSLVSVPKARSPMVGRLLGLSSPILAQQIGRRTMPCLSTGSNSGRTTDRCPTKSEPCGRFSLARLSGRRNLSPQRRDFWRQYLSLSFNFILCRNSVQHSNASTAPDPTLSLTRTRSYGPTLRSLNGRTTSLSALPYSSSSVTKSCVVSQGGIESIAPAHGLGHLIQGQNLDSRPLAPGAWGQER